MRIAILDYGMGNVKSVSNALAFLGYDPFITSSPAYIKNTDVLIFPGVGAFGEGMEELRKRDLIGPILEHIKQGKPFLGLCLGMHLLFESGTEHGFFKGLGVFKGKVIKFDNSFKGAGLKIPHMGWNNINIKIKNDIFSEIEGNPYVYFVHSYFAVPENRHIVAARTFYGMDFCSMVMKDNICAMQFHPEKSQSTGLKLLDNFVKYCCKK